MTSKRLPLSLIVVLAASVVVRLAAQSAPATSLALPMPGITTFHPVTTTIACGSNASPEAMEALRKAGFATIISFSEDTETGYDRPALERTAAAAGLRYVSIPFNRDRPDPKAAQRFLDVIAAPETSPAYLSCRTGQRAAAMWVIKRVKHDGWKVDRAMAEGESLGLTRPELQRFVLDFVGASPH